MAYVAAPIAYAADRNGSYASGGGSGSVDCPTFVAAMARARATDTGLPDLAYIMYLAGYRSAHNRLAPDTCDIFNGLSHDQLLAWLDNYCNAHPLENFGTAIEALTIETHPRRLRKCAH